MVLKGLGLTTDETFTFIQNRKPTYPQFEAWIKQNGGWQDEIALDTLNDKIRNFRHDDETRDYILRLVGLTDETCPLRDYIGLTQLEELAIFHRENSQETTLPDGRKLRPMAAPCPLAAPQQELRDGPDGQPPSGDQVLAAYAGNGD
jgi:hypothetical protein